ncbi:hypothetical protein HBA55_18615 [Pseudomaricurvus alkylphenolicus]|uniref:hypothetical protein n=1 Tax=Pseudomaricurvus alkylphenolicus TaxID=1306991 RepID=UPI00141DA7C7|nr:hypothetical protein [Pseudomaricurvus alkylphenolicus]NIB41624.1 hypothetical protein [Pseudomaricurvus alkylphenolicus]
MGKLSFGAGVGFALFISVFGGVLQSVIEPLLGSDISWRLVITFSAAAYLLLLGHQSNGQSVSLLFVTLLAGALLLPWVIGFDLWGHASFYLGPLWLARCLWFYPRLVSALTDSILQAASFVAALWALQYTGSVGLSLWTFFLCQALFVFIQQFQHRSDKDSPDLESGFHRAHRSAQSALRALLSSQP